MEADILQPSSKKNLDVSRPVKSKKISKTMKYLVFSSLILLTVFLAIFLPTYLSSENKIMKTRKLRAGRPPIEERSFVSEAIDKYIDETSQKIKDPDVSQLFVNCFPNTLDTTVNYNKEARDTFIITGDITAMWLRDSSLQVFPYLPHCKDDDHLNDMIITMFHRQIKSIIIDEFANAFNKDDSKYSPWSSDQTYRIDEYGRKVSAMTKSIWERKFEIDSLILPYFAMSKYYEYNNDFGFIKENENEFLKSLEMILRVVTIEQMGLDEQEKYEKETENYTNYFFQRKGSEPFDSLHQGVGKPSYRCGLVKTYFRNSDDSAQLQFNIPENAILVSTFKKTAKLLEKYMDESEQKEKIKTLIDNLSAFSAKVNESIYEHGVVEDPVTKKKYFTFEIDGYGNTYFMDEPGYPNLISLPFFEFVDKEDPIYLNTRERILSYKNPYYIERKNVYGVASSHSYRNYIWPLFTLMQGLTATDKEEVKYCLELMRDSGKHDHYIHESFNIEDFGQYTRPWFAWANSFFGMLVVDIMKRFPELII